MQNSGHYYQDGKRGIYRDILISRLKARFPTAFYEWYALVDPVLPCNSLLAEIWVNVLPGCHTSNTGRLWGVGQVMNRMAVMVWVGLHVRCNINDTLQYCNHGIYRTVFLSEVGWGTD